jgi:hypothetical protein
MENGACASKGCRRLGQQQETRADPVLRLAASRLREGCGVGVGLARRVRTAGRGCHGRDGRLVLYSGRGWSPGSARALSAPRDRHTAILERLPHPLHHRQHQGRQLTARREAQKPACSSPTRSRNPLTRHCENDLKPVGRIMGKRHGGRRRQAQRVRRLPRPECSAASLWRNYAKHIRRQRTAAMNSTK